MKRVSEELKMKRMCGTKLLVRRFEYPKETELGLDLPEDYLVPEEGVNKEVDLPKYQNRGEVIAIGSEVPEGDFELGDIVHFQANFYQMAFLDKEDLSFMTDKSSYIDNAEIILESLNGVDWIEETEAITG